MKKYEAVFILDIRKVEDEGEAFAQAFAELIKGWGGSIIETLPMGRRQFAREIKKRKAGIYWDFVFEVAPDKIVTLRDKYRLDERVVRLMDLVFDRPDGKSAAGLIVD